MWNLIFPDSLKYQPYMHRLKVICIISLVHLHLVYMTCYMRAGVEFSIVAGGVFKKCLILTHLGFCIFQLGILSLYSFFFFHLPLRSWECKIGDESARLLPGTFVMLWDSCSSFPGIIILAARQMKPGRLSPPLAQWEKITPFCIGSRAVRPPTVCFLLPFSYFCPQKDTNAEIIPREI